MQTTFTRVVEPMSYRAKIRLSIAVGISVFSLFAGGGCCCPLPRLDPVARTWRRAMRTGAWHRCTCELPPGSYDYHGTCWQTWPAQWEARPACYPLPDAEMQILDEPQEVSQPDQPSEAQPESSLPPQDDPAGGEIVPEPKDTETQSDYYPPSHSQIPSEPQGDPDGLEPPVEESLNAQFQRDEAFMERLWKSIRSGRRFKLVSAPSRGLVISDFLGLNRNAKGSHAEQPEKAVIEQDGQHGENAPSDDAGKSARNTTFLRSAQQEMLAAWLSSPDSHGLASQIATGVPPR